MEAAKLKPEVGPPIVLLLGRKMQNEETVFGAVKKGRKEHRKTIILLGTKGSGRSSLVNSVANYLYKIGAHSQYRLYVAGKEKQSKAEYLSALVMEPTTSVHTYLFHGTRVPSSLAIIDTPPLGERIKGQKETACQKIKRWYTTSYDHPCKDIEIWLVISAQQPGVTKEFMLDLKELLEDLDAVHIKVTPVITFSKNRKPVLAMKALDVLGFNTQLENLDYFMVNNESVVPLGILPQTNALPIKESLRNLRALLINATEPIVHILGTVELTAVEEKENEKSVDKEVNNNGDAKNHNLPQQLHLGLKSQTVEDHIYATPKKARSPTNVTRYPVKPSALGKLPKSKSSSQINLISISPYETVV